MDAAYVRDICVVLKLGKEEKTVRNGRSFCYERYGSRELYSIICCIFSADNCCVNDYTPLTNSRTIHKARLLVSPVWRLLSSVPGLVLADFFSREAIASSIAFAILSTSDCSVIFLSRAMAFTEDSTAEKPLYLFLFRAFALTIAAPTFATRKAVPMHSLLAFGAGQSIHLYFTRD